MQTKNHLRLLFVAVLLVLPIAMMAQANKKTLFFISNTHLDTQWNWDVKTTINEYVKNTLTQNMALMDKYPHFMLNYEGAIKYMWMKEYYPEEYAKLQKYIDRGQWHVSGMALDANDVMVSSAESILHSMLYANKFYKQEFGVRGGYDIMLPDCFGFSYVLPSLAHHAGIRGFHTAKLAWGSASYDQLAPFGIWQGVDGSQIYGIYKPGPYDSHEDYNKDMTTSSSMASTITQNYNRYGVAAEIRYVGPRSDHGGGLQDNASSTGENTPYWLNLSAGKTDGQIVVKLATPDEIFDYLDTYKNGKYQVWNDELPMRTHGVGSYTSHGELKYFNRKTELTADAAEKASALAYWLGAREYPSAELRDAWIRTSWQQHHDGITGTSIPKANEYSVNEYFIANRQFGQQLCDAVAATTQYMDTRAEGIPVVVYNPLSHKRTDIAEAVIDGETDGVRVFDKGGNEVLSQITGHRNGKTSIIFAATVPSLGYAVYDIHTGETSTLTSALTVDTDRRQVTNGRYRFTLSANGDLRQLYDLENSRSLTGTVQQQMLYDHENDWPAWEISYANVSKTALGTVNENATITLVEDGALRKAYRVQRTKEGSSFVQYIRMNALSNRVDFINEVDWQSRERMLKAVFPFSFSNEKSTYDISLGIIERGLRNSNHYEFQGHQWADQSATDGTYGVSVLNDCKYGWDKPTASQLRLTLLHTPSCGSYKHQSTMDLGANNFTYSLFPHDGKWSEETQMEAARLNQPLLTFIAPKHEGALGKEVEFISLNTDKVAVKMVKKAEESDEIIVRVYEWAGQDQNGLKMTFAEEIESVREVNALEEEIGSMSHSDKEFTFSIGHYQPKTFAVKLKKANTLEKLANNSTPIELPYNLDLMSWDKNIGDATTVYTYAFPAEQISENVNIDDIPFKMGSTVDGQKNVLRCYKQSISLDRKNGQNAVYLLMASGNEQGTTAEITVGDKTENIAVPYFSGLAAEVENDYNLQSNYRNENIALMATHSHAVSSKKNEIMRQLYIYKYKVELPEGVNEITIHGADRKLMLFAATLSDNESDLTKPATNIFATVGYKELGDENGCGEKLIPSAVKYSHQNGTNEGAAKANDNDPSTKWCVVGSQSQTPYIEYDFNEPVEVCQWFVLNAGIEQSGYITKSCKLQCLNDDGQWEDIDIVDNNTDNKMQRGITPVTTTKVRLQIIKGEQDGTTTRIYEFALYGKTAEETAIKNVEKGIGTEIKAIYGPDGTRRSGLQKGINIIMYEDGHARKTFIK